MALIGRVRAELGPGGGAATVRIRAHPTFSPDALRQAFEMLTPGTPLEGATLAVEARSDPHGCPSCGHSWIPSHDDLIGSVLICPACGRPSALQRGALIEVVEVVSAAGEARRSAARR
jgi:Zn finger protein HypA/HybF involved in hydrogenase expression